ncbi:MAG: DUF2309 domain-containing protein [Cytophagaceae bacterium]
MDVAVNHSFQLEHVLSEIKHFLPAQAPLKDFVHHNSLHAFQHDSFYDALEKASVIFGYKTTLLIEDYRSLYKEGRINHDILIELINQKKGTSQLSVWLDKLRNKEYSNQRLPRVGNLRKLWKATYDIDLDSLVHPVLFRVLCSYLDQGISIWNFPVHPRGFIYSLKEIERNSGTSFFKTKQVKEFFLNQTFSIESLLEMLVGVNSKLYTNYLFDQQFNHPGWSGIVSVVEDNSSTLLDKRKITLNEMIQFELLLEYDALQYQLGDSWKTIDQLYQGNSIELFDTIPHDEAFEVVTLWQDAFEWTYYDQVIAGINDIQTIERKVSQKSFQAMFCIDDREGSIRRYVETADPNSETFGTPGFFNVEFYFVPENGKFMTKLCPAPMNPKYLIKEVGIKKKWKKELDFSKDSHSLFRGWLYSILIGFWSILKLFRYIFKPTMSPAVASSFRHMEKDSMLTIEYDEANPNEKKLQVGFTISEMTDRVEGLLKSIGLIDNFARIVYVIGHGSSSINNPHYAAYDCGACCGRPGSVNARVFSFMANHPQVRVELTKRGVYIPLSTQFVGGLHDTTRDDILFFDENKLNGENKTLHLQNEKVFEVALNNNAKERSRRFKSINTKKTPAQIHEKVRTRSVSLFQPRPELNHATNALCIIGSRMMSKGLFLDRRAFFNSYNYKIDPEGNFLYNIIKAAAPVCGGINLEYYFSRVDNQKLGAGTKLPHNVMGLLGVANGIDGDLRPGLPSQMIEIHDPIRLLMIVEQHPEVVENVIQRDKNTFEWFNKNWIHLIVYNPEVKEFYKWNVNHFEPYSIVNRQIEHTNDITSLIESNEDNFPVYVID